MKTVQLRLRENIVSSHYNKREEERWGMDTLDKYPIAAGDIPAVLKVFRYRIEQKDYLSIREAKWVARLSYVVADIEKLTEYARKYAHFEKIYGLAGYFFNSRRLDENLFGLRDE